MFNFFGEAIQIRFPSASSVYYAARVSLTIWLVVALSVVADLPYGGSVTMQSTRVRGGLRASATIIASAVKPKCARFCFVPFAACFCTSIPMVWQPISLASIMVVPVPQNGSRTVSPVCACARFTMHLASLEFIADGWKKGFLRGLRSTKGFGWISASFLPNTRLWLVRMPEEVLSGFLRLTFA